MLRLALGALLLLSALHAADTSPYIGGNQFNNYYTNPNLIGNFLTQVNGTVSPACNSIAGIGLPILAVKQVLESINDSLSFNNANTAAKVIFFREKKNNTTFQTTYRLVAQIKTFSTNSYIAVEGLYKQVGYPAFEVTTYYMDSDLVNVKAVLGEYNIDPNAYVGCGDVKSIYSQNDPAKAASNGVSAYNQGSNLVNTAPGSANANGAKGASNVDPNLVAQIIKLMTNAK